MEATLKHHLRMDYNPHVGLRDSGGPTRVYDAEAADPHWKPTPAGFIVPPPDVKDSQPDPLVWSGDDA